MSLRVFVQYEGISLIHTASNRESRMYPLEILIYIYHSHENETVCYINVAVILTCSFSGQQEQQSSANHHLCKINLNFFCIHVIHLTLVCKGKQQNWSPRVVPSQLW